ncbi:hypothetical protein N8I77_010725 [Diaporthe amygdali]|uniref:Uncharacterized protein n=1 Tax=Phomopsis amygdali TaxID=1214568 RepID=A0AAD9S7G9_PHOAM|nr:hypothetical protein N8I77_010725 [Diaporthe amygdali]
MASTRKRADSDDNPLRAKKHKRNAEFTLMDFMKEFPPIKGPLKRSSDEPLPCTVLEGSEMQNPTDGRRGGRTSIFNIRVPERLPYDPMDPSARFAPYWWLKRQYSHCIIPELGEKYNFGFEDQTFHCLRDLHNARVHIRQSNPLSENEVYSLATRWIRLEEKDRPSSDGYLDNGEIYVATCLPSLYNEETLAQYLEDNYWGELSASHYMPRSKYSVHFVGKPRLGRKEEIESINVATVLIRNTKTGDVIHLDTGPLSSRHDRAVRAGEALRAWLKFQKDKEPEAELGPISYSEPLMLDLTKETLPSLASYHALVSATLFLRRRIINWGDVKAFQSYGNAKSNIMARSMLQNISGWLGLKSAAKAGEQLANPKSKAKFAEYYYQGSLQGRNQPLPISERIATAQKGESDVLNEEPASDLGSDEGDDREEIKTDQGDDSATSDRSDKDGGKDDGERGDSGNVSEERHDSKKVTFDQDDGEKDEDQKDSNTEESSNSNGGGEDDNDEEEEDGKTSNAPDAST